MSDALSERRDGLLWVAASPTIWAGHFLLSYATAAVWCAKYAGPEASLSGARMAIAVYTGAALVGVGSVAWRGLRQYRRAAREAGEDSESVDSPAARHRFLGFTLLTLSGLSALAILFEALAAVFMGSCH
jgi:hypothetical protein